MTTHAITVAGLCKDYQIRHAGNADRTLYDVIGRALKSPFRGSEQDEPATERFWALRDVNFRLQPGEVAGVIGRNGAGKSTLLKILSRITAPTKGRIEVRGRLASLLEVGTGFHPELSGRENIFLNGAILGMTRAEVARKFDEIVAFAEIDKFVDTPVKRYSSGMYVRLAFAVAAHLETDVLLVDEVLAVGDASFQRKSLGKMSDVAKGGRTVLFVSHNLGSVRNLCSRALWFEGGELAYDGNVDKALALYERTFSSAANLADNARFQGALSGQLRFDRFVCKQGGQPVTVIDPLSDFQIEISGTALRSFPALELKIAFFRDGLHLGSCHDTPAEAQLHEGAFTSVFHIPGDTFRPGRYMIGLGATASVASWTWGADVAALDFSENTGGRTADRNAGLIAIPFRAERIQQHEALVTT
jgi:lipopolysaccharide transport system ATP-binding protein